MRDLITLSKWEGPGRARPTLPQWIRMLHPDHLRAELESSGVIVWYHGRWFIDPGQWRNYVLSAAERLEMSVEDVLDQVDLLIAGQTQSPRDQQGALS